MAFVADKHTIVFVTGPSGAGRTTALRALEDLGWDVIDNLPLALLGHLLSGPQINNSLALGVDVRNRDFSVQAVLDAVDDVKSSDHFTPSLLFLDAKTEVLIKRFSETRRRHPLGRDRAVLPSIVEEDHILTRLRERADILIDTTELSPHDLKSEISKWYGMNGTGFLTVSLQSFSYKRGIPRGVDMVMDCRFLRNPHWEEKLRHLTGVEEKVQAYIEEDPKFDPFYEKVKSLMLFLLPAYLDEGKSNFGLAFGCTGGKHRSVFLTEKLAKDLKPKGWIVKIIHRELNQV